MGVGWLKPGDGLYRSVAGRSPVDDANLATEMAAAGLLAKLGAIPEFDSAHAFA